MDYNLRENACVEIPLTKPNPLGLLEYAHNRRTQQRTQHRLVAEVGAQAFARQFVAPLVPSVMDMLRYEHQAPTEVGIRHMPAMVATSCGLVGGLRELSEQRLQEVQRRDNIRYVARKKALKDLMGAAQELRDKMDKNAEKRKASRQSFLGQRAKVTMAKDSFLGQRAKVTMAKDEKETTVVERIRKFIADDDKICAARRQPTAYKTNNWAVVHLGKFGCDMRSR